MKYLMALSIIIVLLYSAANAALQDGTPLISWEHPVMNEDGSALAIEDLRETVHRCYPNPDAPVPVNLPKEVNKIIPIPANTWQAEVGEFDSGEYRCVAMSVNTDGIMSRESTPVNFLIPYKTPLSPVYSGVE